MSRDRLPPPQSAACLVRQRSSSQKGGTIIAEDVIDLETHERRLSAPDGYRPPSCPGCGDHRLHVHDYRERHQRSDPGKSVVKVVRHVCVGCAAAWQTLPAFIALHLWRSWPVVERTLTGEEPAAATRESRRWPRVAARTRRRWRARWLRPARFLVQVLATCGEVAWSALAYALGPEATCADLVVAYAAAEAAPAGQRLAGAAALIYRLSPRVRLV